MCACVVAEAGVIGYGRSDPQSSSNKVEVSGSSSEQKMSDSKDFISIKVICLGDSAVGKSKLVERFLADQCTPQRRSTYTLTLFKYETKIKGRRINVALQNLKMFALLILAVVAISYSESIPLSSSSMTYIKTGECKVNEVCLYHYVVDQQFGNGSAQNLSFAAAVDIGCHSVGIFNDTSATQFCMKVTDTNMDGIATTNRTKQQQNEMIDRLLSQWFCFIQTDNGKVVAVQHASDEKQSAIDLKKSIAAAFQANFRGTKEEIESDPQSEHIAHYKHKQGPSNVKKMHRHIDDNDVIDYSSGAKKKNIKLMKDEDIEYRDGFLYHSSGSTLLHIKQGEKAVEKSVAEAFAAEGSYTLDLEHCYIPAIHVQSRRRKSVDEEMQKSSMEEDIKAHYDKSQHARERMLLIRESIPSVSDALRELHTNPENLKLFDMLEHLLELEYQFGKQPKYKSALEDILAYYQMIQHSKISQDAKMRETIYSLLSAEGSLTSQMTLLEALQSSSTNDEKATVTIVISAVQNAHINFVAALQQLLSTMGNSIEKNSLLLSFGALSSNAQPDIQLAIAAFLVQQINFVNDNDISEIVHILLAMGNTGSNHVVSTIIEYVDHPSKEIQKAALEALVKFTYLEEVQSSLHELLASGPDEEILNIVSKTLIEGQLYAEGMDIDMSIESSYPMLSTLVSAVLSTNDTELIGRVAGYVRKVGNGQALSLLHQLHTRLRRGTDWDAYNSDYDCIASQSSRASDVLTYQRHKAYIHGYTLGTNDVNMKIGGGIFLGISNDCNNMKAFARACAQANVFSWSASLAEIQLIAEKSGAIISGSAYARIGGNTLLNYQRSVDTRYCLTYERNLYERRQRLFEFSYSIWIYIGYAEASISLYLSLTADFVAEMCASLNLNELVSATTGIVPQVSLTLEGSASYTFIEVARVGFSAEADFTYQIEPRATGKACATSCSSGDYQTCAGMYQEWPGNTISLYAWYQTREIEWCEGWWGIWYPCGFDWGDRYSWDALSWSWSIGNPSRTALIEACYPTSSSCSASSV